MKTTIYSRAGEMLRACILKTFSRTATSGDTGRWPRPRGTRAMWRVTQQYTSLLRVMVMFLALATGARAQDSTRARGSAAWNAAVLGTQMNIIGQSLSPLHSPYSGVNSLTDKGDRQLSQAYGVYVGGRLLPGLETYLDIEMIRGSGLSNVTGLGGITNGDVVRQGTVDLGQDPYVARAFVRYSLPLPGTAYDTVDRAMDQMPGPVAKRRLQLDAGRLAVTDLMDLNRYAGSTRLQFQNWALFQNTAWDYAADTRGYSNGVALAWIEPRWSLRIASFQMPTLANGNEFDSYVNIARGDEAELTLAPNNSGTVIRLLYYVNRARMGNYRKALDVAQAGHATPDIVADDQEGRIKHGFGINIEQPLADSGETGLFARLGWNDGKTESFAFTEVDRVASAGLQLAGTRWRRREDRVGIAAFAHGISDDHRAYLAAGGVGFLLGDGRLRYGCECGIEAYYRVQVGSRFEISPDIQHIWNPGYNRDRGPATIVALRINMRY